MATTTWDYWSSRQWGYLALGVMHTLEGYGMFQAGLIGPIAGGIAASAELTPIGGVAVWAGLFTFVGLPTMAVGDFMMQLGWHDFNKFFVGHHEFNYDPVFGLIDIN